MTPRQKCPVKGCPGMADITTNGNGAAVDRCSCCEKRAQWERQNLPPRTARCEICGGEWKVSRKAGRLPRACDACKPLLARLEKLKKEQGGGRPHLASKRGAA